MEKNDIITILIKIDLTTSDTLVTMPTSIGAYNYVLFIFFISIGPSYVAHTKEK